MKRSTAAIAAIFAIATCTVRAQAPLNSLVPVILNILTVNDNLDRTLEFYHHLLGLQSTDTEDRKSTRLNSSHT